MEVVCASIVRITVLLFIVHFQGIASMAVMIVEATAATLSTPSIHVDSCVCTLAR